MRCPVILILLSIPFVPFIQISEASTISSRCDTLRSHPDLFKVYLKYPLHAPWPSIKRVWEDQFSSFAEQDLLLFTSTPPSSHRLLRSHRIFLYPSRAKIPVPDDRLKHLCRYLGVCIDAYPLPLHKQLDVEVAHPECKGWACRNLKLS